MAIFRYEAADTTGKLLRGAMDAGSAQEVQQRLAERGFRQVRVHHNAATPPTQVVAQSPPTKANAAAVGSIPRPEDVGLFFRQMASLLHAGFTISAALADLGPRTGQRGLRGAAVEMAQATANGASLAGQMARYPHLFAPHVIGLVAAGETGGFVEFAFEEAALNAEQDAALRQGLWMPKFLFWQSIWSVLLFAPFFPSLDLNNVGASFAKYGRVLLLYMVPLGIAFHAVALLVGWMRHQPFARDFFDGLSLRLPVMARLAKMRALASFTRVLRRLLMSGISVEPAYLGAANSVPNAVLRNRMLAGAGVLRTGQGIDAAIQAAGLMDNDPLQLLVTGQRTGQWIEMLDRVTAWYQEEAARATEGARLAQRRMAVLITIISTGYVTIAATHGCMTMGFKLTEGWND